MKNYQYCIINWSIPHNVCLTSVFPCMCSRLITSTHSPLLTTCHLSLTSKSSFITQSAGFEVLCLTCRASHDWAGSHSLRHIRVSPQEQKFHTPMDNALDRLSWIRDTSSFTHKSTVRRGTDGEWEWHGICRMHEEFSIEQTKTDLACSWCFLPRLLIT